MATETAAFLLRCALLCISKWWITACWPVEHSRTGRRRRWKLPDVCLRMKFTHWMAIVVHGYHLAGAIHLRFWSLTTRTDFSVWRNICFCDIRFMLNQTSGRASDTNHRQYGIWHLRGVQWCALSLSPREWHVWLSMMRPSCFAGCQLQHQTWTWERQLCVEILQAHNQSQALLTHSLVSL